MSDPHYRKLVNDLFPGAELRGVEQLTGGISADVCRLDLFVPGDESKHVVVREHGPTHSGHSANLEYRLLDALFRSGVPVPRPLHVDETGQTLESPFLVMAFVKGSTEIPLPRLGAYISKAAEMLAKIHSLPTKDIPELPYRLDPLPELLEFLPAGKDWHDLTNYLQTLQKTVYLGTPCLLHGDFWPENLLWEGESLVAILDWEDAAIGDPLSDLACSRLELRYKFGSEGVRAFTEAYGTKLPIDSERLALWQLYVSAAAQHFMGEWGLAPEREAYMRAVTLASIQEAGAALMYDVEFQGERTNIPLRL